MGDIRKVRRKFDTPSHPWQAERIIEEREILQQYGLKNKKEIWKMTSLLKGFKDEAKKLSSRADEQSKKEERQLVGRLASLGLMSEQDPMDKILGLTLKEIADRRLQTLLVKKGMARTMSQARQFITHGHITVKGKKITFPSYMVRVSEEGLVQFIPKSNLARDDHPERIVKETAKEKVDKKKKQEKEEVPPAFSEEELAKLEESGVVERVVEVIEEEEEPKKKKK